MEPYITTDGREIPLKAVGRRFVEQVMAKHPIPEVPTYEVTTVAGDIERHPHSIKIGEDGKEITTFANEEDRETWDAYKKAEREALQARYEAAARFLLYQCVDLGPEPPDTWGIDFELWGLTVPDPDDKIDFKIFWIENVLVPDADDMAALLARLYAMGGIIGKDRVQEFENFFRFTLVRLATGGDRGRPAGGAQSPGPIGGDAGA